MENSKTNRPRKLWFFTWLEAAWPRVYGLIFDNKWLQNLEGLGEIGLLGIPISGYIWITGSTKNPANFIFYINDLGHIALLLFALLGFFPYLGIKKGKDEVTEAVHRFQIWIYALLITWLIFYIFRAVVDGAVLASRSPNLFADQISSYVNLFSAFCFFALYLTTENVGNSHLLTDGRTVRIMVAIIVVGIIQFLADARIIKDVFPVTIDEVQVLAAILNGLIVGVAMALLIGRLDSRYIGLHKAIITTLYSYALIQPLFPYIFSRSPSGLQLIMQYVFIAAALLMKVIFLSSLGRLINERTLNFYIRRMRWLDLHAEKIRQRHSDINSAESIGLYLFSVVPSNAAQAHIRVAKTPDVRIELGIFNAWSGIDWEIREWKASELQISETTLPIKSIRISPGFKRVSRIAKKPRHSLEILKVRGDERLTVVSLEIDSNLLLDEFIERLRNDSVISQEIHNLEKEMEIPVIVRELQACASIDDGREKNHEWETLDPIDPRKGLYYSAILNLKDLKVSE